VLRDEDELLSRKGASASLRAERTHRRYSASGTEFDILLRESCASRGEELNERSKSRVDFGRLSSLGYKRERARQTLGRYGWERVCYAR